MRRLFALTIWAPGAIPAGPERQIERDLKKKFLPTFDLLMIAVGLLGARFLVPALSEVMPDRWVDPICLVFAGVSFACLVGVSFPALWRLEQLAKAVMFGMLLGFLGNLFWIIITSPGRAADSRWYFIPFVVLALVVCSWSMLRLARERSDRASLEEAEADELASEET
jgi:hypothetical protein